MSLLKHLVLIFFVTLAQVQKGNTLTGPDSFKNDSVPFIGGNVGGGLGNGNLIDRVPPPPYVSLPPPSYSGSSPGYGAPSRSARGCGGYDPGPFSGGGTSRPQSGPGVNGGGGWPVSVYIDFHCCSSPVVIPRQNGPLITLVRYLIPLLSLQ